ncbi:TraB family protein, partial [Perilla frutescens var. frutescens]
SSKVHHPLPLPVGDRPVEITMRRTWANMSPWQKTKLRSSELFEAVCLLSPEYVTKKLKELDDGDMLPPAFQEMSKRFPALMETLVHERDQYMSATLLRVAREHNSVVAVVRMGHLVGIQKNWKQPVDLKKLLSMPPEKKRTPVGNILFYVAATVYIISGIYRSINT